MRIYVVTTYNLQGKYDYELVNAQFFRRFAQKQTIIDNGVYEFFHIMKKSVDFDEITEKQVEIFNRAFIEGRDAMIVLPDTPFDKEKTTLNVTRFLRKFENIDRKKMFGVIQAKTEKELIDILDFYYFSDIKNIAIPIKLRQLFPDFVEKIIDYVGFKKIHLLGFDLTDLCLFKEFGLRFRSIDTSYPLKCEILKIDYGKDAPRPLDYFDKEIDYVDIKKFKRWLRNESKK